MNARSSRSHCLVHVHLVSRTDAAGGGTSTLTKRQMLFVDLAGSERIARSNVVGMRLNEAVGINKSLTVLGRVIKALGEGGSHVPFRDSMLTMLLKSSFGGRSCTSVVVNVASDACHLDESVCSLRFGSRMLRVRNNATVVVGQDADEVADDVARQLGQARRDLAALERKGLGPRFAAGSNASEMKSFLRNQALSESLKVKLTEARQDLSEVRGRGEGKSSGRGGRGGLAESMADKVKELEFQVENIRMILLRQKSIKGFYKEPSSSFTAKQAEIRALEASMKLYHGDGAGGAGEKRRRLSQDVK